MEDFRVTVYFTHLENEFSVFREKAFHWHGVTFCCVLPVTKFMKLFITENNSHSESTPLLHNGREPWAILPPFSFQIIHKVSINVHPVIVSPVTILAEKSGHITDQFIIYLKTKDKKRCCCHLKTLK